MFIQKTTKQDFDARQHSKAITGFSSSVTSKLCAQMREELYIPITQMTETSVDVYSAKEYIEKISQTIPLKVGVKLDESNFVAFGISREFLTKCAYYWGGGRIGAPKLSPDGTLSSAELALYKRFLELVEPTLSRELTKCSKAEVNVGLFDDKGVVLNNDQVIHVNAVKCNFHNETVEVNIITSGDALKICDLSTSNEDGSSQNDISQIALTMDVVFEPIEADLLSVGELMVGESIELPSSSLRLINSADGAIFAKGAFGSDSKGNHLLKITETTERHTNDQ